jgi:hypothetical protein
MIRRLALPLAVLTLALASCGDDDDETTAETTTPTTTTQAGGGGGDKPQNPYDAAKLACSEPPVEETALSVGLPPEANEQEIADLYGKAVETTPGAQQESADGCLAGLRQAPSG